MTRLIERHYDCDGYNCRDILFRVDDDNYILRRTTDGHPDELDRDERMDETAAGERLSEAAHQRRLRYAFAISAPTALWHLDWQEGQVLYTL